MTVRTACREPTYRNERFIRKKELRDAPVAAFPDIEVFRTGWTDEGPVRHQQNSSKGLNRAIEFIKMSTFPRMTIQSALKPDIE
jgi:hypothetical protein